MKHFIFIKVNFFHLNTKKIIFFLSFFVVFLCNETPEAFFLCWDINEDMSIDVSSENKKKFTEMVSVKPTPKSRFKFQEGEEFSSTCIGQLSI